MKKFSEGKAVINVLSLLLLVGVIGVGVVATKDPQIFQPKAASDDTAVLSASDGSSVPPNNPSAAAAGSSLKATLHTKCSVTFDFSWTKASKGGYGVELWESKYEPGAACTASAPCYFKWITSNSTTSVTGPGGFVTWPGYAPMPDLKLGTSYTAFVYYDSTKKDTPDIKFTTPSCK